MGNQVEYYNQFGKLHEQSILNCPEPELWTTDYDQKGPVYEEMRERLEVQERFIQRYFSKAFPVLDIGCGFGRQASWMAKEGFRVTCTDSSEVFIDLAEKLFKKHQYTGDFLPVDLLDFHPSARFRQVLLLDVLEHIPSTARKRSIAHIDSLMEKDAVLIISIPHVRKRFTSYMNNLVVKWIKEKFIYFHNREEHPFPIPVKRQVLNLCEPYFTLLEFKESHKTDYYTFRKN